MIVFVDNPCQGLYGAGWSASAAGGEDRGDVGPGEGQEWLGAVGVIVQAGGRSPDQLADQRQGDSVAAVQEGDQDAVAVVEIADSGVVSAPVDALESTRLLTPLWLMRPLPSVAARRFGPRPGSGS